MGSTTERAGQIVQSFKSWEVKHTAVILPLLHPSPFYNFLFVSSLLFSSLHCPQCTLSRDDLPFEYYSLQEQCPTLKAWQLIVHRFILKCHLYDCYSPKLGSFEQMTTLGNLTHHSLGTPGGGV